MSEHTTGQEPEDKRLERAAKHVSDYWFPVNPDLLKKIQAEIGAGTYDANLDGLVQEIRSDFSLFTFCLQKLVKMMRASGEAIPESFNPVNLLQESSLETLKQILDIDENTVSVHDLEDSNNLQIARFQEVLVSASTAEMLSEKYDVDSDAAYSAALLRQLGVTLIAWNYPGVYEEAISSLKPGDKLDLVLAQYLGFSPSMLAIRILDEWGISAASCSSMGLSVYDESDDLEQQIFEGIGAVLSDICKVGEALARANDPEHYPSSKGDWEFAKHEIEDKLGPDGLKLIKEQFEIYSENYLTFVPETFTAGLVLSPEAHIDVDGSEHLHEKNPFIGRSEPRVRTELLSLYRRLDPDPLSQQNLRMLVREVVPVTEFNAGYVYTIDAGVLMLVPQLQVGTPTLRKFKAVDTSVILSNTDMVAVAYRSVEPVVEYKKDNSGNIITAVAGMFGQSQKVGVLYLEIPSDVSSDPDSPHVIHFNALRFALNDCLNLK